MAELVKGQEIFDKVRDILTEALGVDAQDIKMESTLMSDLGGESIDFLDVIFRLEKTFGIKIPKGDLFPTNAFTNKEYVQGGKVTEAGLAMLREKMPYADLNQFEKAPLANKIQDLFTVRMIVGYVAGKLGPT